MQNNSKNIEKPVAEVIRPDLTSLPELTDRRLRYRLKWARRCRWFVRIFTKAKFFGLENFPQKGPGLIIGNHLGNMDAVLGLASGVAQPEALGTSDLYDHPRVGKLLNAYGMIWVHRGTADRRALRCALSGLAQGRFVAIFPEGRQSITHSLEEGTGGAAFLAMKAQVPIIPLAFTGTEDENTYGNWRRMRRPEMTLTIGKPFHLSGLPKGRSAIKIATRTMMLSIAELLPESYRGVYAAE